VRSLALPRPPAGLAGGIARRAPFVLLLLAGVALIVAEFLTLREIVAVTVVPAGGRTTGGAHHGYALAVIGAASLPMTWGAVRGGSRPAAAAVAALGAVAFIIALAVDSPSLGDTGLIGRTYDLAAAHAGVGFYVEVAASVVLILGGMVQLRRNAEAAREAGASRAARRRARGSEDDAAPGGQASEADAVPGESASDARARPAREADRPAAE
jgi:hypothetical protein